MEKWRQQLKWEVWRRRLTSRTWWQLLSKELWQQRFKEGKAWLPKLKKVPHEVWGSMILAICLIGLTIWIQQVVFAPASKPVTVFLKTPVAPFKVAEDDVPQFAPIADFEPIATPLAELTPIPEATPTPKQTPTATPTRIYVFHTVKARDTLISIAAHYNITTEALLAANEIRDPNSLEEGQPLLIPPKDRPVDEKIVLHQVKEGDSPLDIATKYGSSVKDIQAANPHLNLKNLKVGETVAVPVIFAEINPVSPEGSATSVYHTVKSGDTPLALAAHYNVPVEILLTVNEITDPTKLQIGQVLTIPPHDGITLGFPVVLYELTETDTLVGIASRFGSSVKDILAVNPDLDPANLEAGQLVAVPVIFAPVRPTPAPLSPSAPRPTPGPPPASLRDLEQQMIAAVNQRREANGLPPYRPDVELGEAALKHSQDMVVRDFLSHVNPDGEGLRDRLAEFGIGAVANVGENIQKNTQPAGKTVETAINWFMNSAPHRANILHPRHNRIGVGIVEGPPGWYTYTLVFAER